MRSTPSLLLLLLLVVPLAAVSACCHCKEAVPLLSAEYRECRHPKLAEIDRCLEDCAGAGPSQKPVCTRNCCTLASDIAGAMPAEKDALRVCRAECR